MPFVKRPDARIWWDQSGAGDPILLIMGHAYGPHMWHRTAPELAASYRVIRFDNRGTGRSSDPPGPYPVQLMADDALAVLDAAGAASAHVYGVSMGGFIALQLALGHPGTVLYADPRVHRRLGGGRVAWRTTCTSPVPGARRRPQPDGMEAALCTWHPGQPPSGRSTDRRGTRASGRGRRGQLIGAASFDVTSLLAEIGIPTLVIHEPCTASSPLSTVNDSPTALPEPGWRSSRQRWRCLHHRRP